MNGRLRAPKNTWHRVEGDVQYRYTYFNEEFESTIHSESISELVQPGSSFRELFIPDPPSSATRAAVKTRSTLTSRKRSLQPALRAPTVKLANWMVRLGSRPYPTPSNSILPPVSRVRKRIRDPPLHRRNRPLHVGANPKSLALVPHSGLMFRARRSRKCGFYARHLASMP